MVSGSHIFTFQRLLKYMLEFPECDEVSCMEEVEEEGILWGKDDRG